MDDEAGIEVMGALAQTTRLAAYRLLFLAGVDGRGPGDLARELGVAPNTMSAHLIILTRAGLIAQSRSGRHITYRAMPTRVAALVRLLGPLGAVDP